MKPSPLIAIVITTYNNPRFLGLCLESLVNQTFQNFEVFIADDGSKSDTREMIERYQKTFANPIHHFWHEDRGFTKPEIDNRVFKELHAAKFVITICIDHDGVCHRRFVEDHLEYHRAQGFKRGVFMGRRVELGPQITQSLTTQKISRFNRGLSWELLLSGLRGDSQHCSRALRLPRSGLSRFMKRDRVPDLLGSNFSFTTDLIHEVNGYDENFTQYWGEDGDLFIRFRNSGAAMGGWKGYAIQYHLYHRRQEPSQANMIEYEKMLARRDYVRCKNGILKE